MSKTIRSTGSRFTIAGAVATMLANANIVSAHPGHGNATSQTGFWHYVTSPVHMVPLLLLTVLILTGLWLAFEMLNQSSD